MNFPAVGGTASPHFHFADGLRCGRQPLNIINMGAVQGEHKTAGRYSSVPGAMNHC